MIIHIRLPFAVLRTVTYVLAMVGIRLRDRFRVPARVLTIDSYTVLGCSIKQYLNNHRFTDATRVVQQATGSHICALSEVMGKPEGIFEKRMAKGDIGFICLEKNEILGHKWLCLHQGYFEKQYWHSISLSRKAAWTYDAFVRSEHRNKGVWKLLTQREFTYAQNNGKESIYCIVRNENRKSLSAHMAYGFTPRSWFFCCIFYGIGVRISDTKQEIVYE